LTGTGPSGIYFMAKTITTPLTSPSFPGQFVSTEVPRLCGGVIEAAWLSAVVLVPCVFNTHSVSGYQPNKIAVLRLLALVIAAAWITKSAGADRSLKAAVGDALRLVRRSPFMLSLGALALVHGLATLFSVNPYASLWGSYETAQGLFTFVCGLVIFAALVAHLRSQEQIERLITTITVASFPLALYGLIERAGYDSIPRLGHFRVMSLLGHPMYFAAYLLLVIPPTLWRILSLAGKLRAGSKSRGWLIAGLGLYGLILLAQVGAFVLTESRGALLGLIAGMFFFAASVGVLRQRRSLLILGSAVTAAVLVMLALLNIPNGPLQRWTSLPVMHRFSQTFSAHEAAASVRLDYWATAVKIMSSKEPLPFPQGGYDHFHWLRPLIGYGPETVECVLPQEYSYPVPDTKLENRLHNLVLDTWFNLGALGVTALTACYALAFLQGYRRLGWVSSSRSIVLFLVITIGLALGAAIALVLWRGPAFLGVGLQCGLAAGLVLYPVTAFFLGGQSITATISVFQSETLLLAVLAALLAHLVDTAFGFETAATSVLVWVYWGVILILSQTGSLNANDSRSGLSQMPSGADASPGKGAGIQRNSGPAPALRNGLDWRLAMLSAAITALVLVSLLFAFIQVYSYEHFSAASVLVRSLTQLDNGHRNNPFLLAVLLMAWAGGCLAFTLDHAVRHPNKHWGPQLLLALTISGLVAGAYAGLKGLQISDLTPLADSSDSVWAVMRQGSGYVWVCVVFFGICTGLVLWAGWCCHQEAIRPRRNPIPVLMAGFGSAAVIALIAWFTIFQFLRGDIYARWAVALNIFGEKSMAAEVFRRALSVNPRPLVYRGPYSQLLEEMAEQAPDEPAFEDLMTQAEHGLLAAPCSGLDRGALLLGGLYLKWAAQEQDPEKRQGLAKKADAALDQALVFEPKMEFVWRESATAESLLPGEEAEVKAKNLKASELARKLNQLEFANFYAQMSRLEKIEFLQRQYGSYAMEYYDDSLADAVATGASTFSTQMAKAGLALELGDTNQAIASYTEAAKLAGEPQSWQAEKALASIYAGQGDLASSLQHLARAKERTSAALETAGSKKPEALQ
jgi:hypothetical protein